MQQPLRPYVTAGVALVGASMIAVTPVATPLPGLSQLSRDFQLTSGFELPDFGQIIQDGFQGISTDAQTLFADLGIATQSLFSALSDPATALSNLETAFAATTFLAGDQKSFLIGGDDLSTGAAALSNDSFHAILFAILTSPTNPLDPTAPPLLPESLVPLINVISSPLAGDLFGHVSPLVAPVVPFLNPFMELIADLQNGTSPDIGALASELLAAPLNSFFGLFTGSTLDLDPLLPLVEASGLLPAAFPVTGLSLAFGGLLSPGATVAGAGSTPFAFPSDGAGGSILNALGINTILPIDGNGVGPLGGDIGLIWAMSQALLGNLPPLQPEGGGDGPPVAATDFLSTVFGGGGLDQLFQELFSDLGLDQIAQELGLSIF